MSTDDSQDTRDCEDTNNNRSSVNSADVVSLGTGSNYEDQANGRDRSYSRSREASPTERKVRKMSRSRSGSYERSRSRRRSPSRSPPPRSRSRSRSGRRKTDRDNPEPTTVLGLFGLSHYSREEDLRRVVEEYATPEKVVVVYDRRTGKSRGFAFVYFPDVDSATIVRDKLNGTEIDGRKIRVDYSVTDRPHTPTPGQYMGRRMGYRDKERGYGGGGGYGGYRRSPYGGRRSPPRYRNGGDYGRDRYRDDRRHDDRRDRHDDRRRSPAYDDRRRSPYEERRRSPAYDDRRRSPVYEDRPRYDERRRSPPRYSSASRRDYY